MATQKPIAVSIFLQTSLVMAADLVLQHVHLLSAFRHISASKAITNSSQNKGKVGEGHAPS